MINFVKGKKSGKITAIIEKIKENNIESLRVIDISDDTLKRIIDDIINKKGKK